MTKLLGEPVPGNPSQEDTIFFDLDTNTFAVVGNVDFERLHEGVEYLRLLSRFERVEQNSTIVRVELAPGRILRDMPRSFVAPHVLKPYFAVVCTKTGGRVESPSFLAIVLVGLCNALGWKPEHVHFIATEINRR